jgi:hypothetical protein
MRAHAQGFSFDAHGDKIPAPVALDAVMSWYEPHGLAVLIYAKSTVRFDSFRFTLRYRGLGSARDTVRAVPLRGASNTEASPFKVAATHAGDVTGSPSTNSLLREMMQATRPGGLRLIAKVLLAEGIEGTHLGALCITDGAFKLAKQESVLRLGHSPRSFGTAYVPTTCETTAQVEASKRDDYSEAAWFGGHYTRPQKRTTTKPRPAPTRTQKWRGKRSGRGGSSEQAYDGFFQSFSAKPLELAAPMLALGSKAALAAEAAPFLRPASSTANLNWQPQMAWGGSTDGRLPLPGNLGSAPGDAAAAAAAAAAAVQNVQPAALQVQTAVAGYDDDWTAPHDTAPPESPLRTRIVG